MNLFKGKRTIRYSYMLRITKIFEEWTNNHLVNMIHNIGEY